jgi:hypothetical protein
MLPNVFKIVLVMGIIFIMIKPVQADAPLLLPAKPALHVQSTETVPVTTPENELSDVENYLISNQLFTQIQAQKYRQVMTEMVIAQTCMDSVKR